MPPALLGFLAIALVPLLVLLDTGIAYARGWRTNSRLDYLLLACCAAWLAAAVAAWGIPAGRRFLIQRRAQLILLLVVGSISLVAAELLVGPLVERFREPFHLRPPGQHVVFHPKPGVMRGVGAESHTNVNSQGVRGPEMPPREEAYRILCLGGSSTACTYLDDTKPWPALVARRLNDAGKQRVWVGNAGLPSRDARDHLRFARESELMKQIDCLVIQVGVNDLTRALRGETPAPPLWQHSRILGLVRNVFRSFANDADIQVEDEAGKAYERRRATRQRAAISDELTTVSGEPFPISQHLQNYRETLVALIARCRELNVRLVFTTQAVLWRADLSPELERDLWFGRLADGRFLAVGPLRRLMDEYNGVLRATCRAEGVPLIDLDELSGSAEFFYDDCHFTEAGSVRVAEIIAAWFGTHPAEKRP